MTRARRGPWGWAVTAWFPAVAGSWGLWLLEGNSVAAAVSVLLVLVTPGLAAPPHRLLVVSLAVSAVWAGPLTFIAALLAASGIHGRAQSAAATTFAGAAAYLLIPTLQGLPDVLPSTIPLASFGLFLSYAAISAIASMGAFGWRSAVAVLGTAIVMLALLDAAATGLWIGPAHFTEPVFRIALVLLPSAVAALFTPITYAPQLVRGYGLAFVAFLVIGLAIGAGTATKKPIEALVFDESHGRWETTLASFGPEDFGRGANYTYSLLFDYSRRLTGAASVYIEESQELPGTDAAFVLKMPTKAMSDEFRERLEAWVRGGGRLIVVADHTDLYDSAQHLNLFLERVGVRVGKDAVYDATGMPNAPETPRSFAALGRVDALGRPHPWQTGASLPDLPFGAVALASFGPSFAEPGDYSRQNRFGPFVPRLTLPYTSHVAVASFALGRGAIAVVSDSTPWSNFSFFKEENPGLFRGILGALERPTAIRTLGWAGLALALAAVATAALSSSIPPLVGALLLGIAVGVGFSISLPSTAAPVEGREFGLRVTLGPQARTEFLAQLVGPGERNYSRIISSTAKYGHMPLATPPGDGKIDLEAARRWLVLEPAPASLPQPSDVLDHLRRGRDLTVLFSPDSAADVTVRRWIVGLDLTLANTSGLATVEDAGHSGKGSFMSRRGAALMRDTRAVTIALPSALLAQISTDRLIQSYTARPTAFPRTSGILNIGFSVDQFADEAIGDVWEGVWPSVLGRLRERQMAAALAGEPLPAPWPEEATVPSPSASAKSRLASFAILEDGVTLLKGEVKDGSPSLSPLSISDDPVAWAADLRSRALSFLETRCPAGSGMTECSDRMIGPDGIEWMVSRLDYSGALVAVELLHERRFSGLGATINVVYADAP